MNPAALPIDADLFRLAAAKDYCDQDELLPKPYKPADLDAVKAEVIEFLHNTPLMNLSTVTPEGWPVGHCMHFSTVEHAGGRPVIYTFTHKQTRKLVNLAGNPRVSISCYKTISFERRRETRAFYGTGLAKVFDDGPDWRAAESAHETKSGQEYVKLLRTERQPLVRIDILRGVWFNPQRKPQHGLIDYVLENADGV